jgi:predicted Rossmann fold flavoprotein
VSKPSDNQRRVCIAGGGASGFFAAIQCKSACPEAEVILLEKSRKLLAKVRISGGGRCNVTHACFDPRTLTQHYPRGQRELLGPFHQFNPSHTVDWFESRGVKLKTEDDGRMFPVSNDSASIIDCLMMEAERVGVVIQTERGLKNARWNEDQHGFDLELSDGQQLTCACLMLATGGNRQSAGLTIAEQLGHRIIDPVPSLFTFHIEAPLLAGLAGITVEHVETAIEGSKLKQTGPLLITHWGASGPAILKLSAWGARVLAERDYAFTLRVNWLPDLSRDALETAIAELRQSQGARDLTRKSPFPGIPRRLWERFMELAAIAPGTSGSQLAKASANTLMELLLNSRLPVNGKSMNKEEFVTAGGVDLKEINMKTMESRVQPNLFMAGEILDIDGVTGGFNFQAAWTGGYLAGRAMAEIVG